MKRGMEFITLLAEFFDSYLPDTKGVSENTIRSYKAALRLFFTFLEEEKGIHPEKVTFSILDSGMIDEFLSWLENTRGCSKQTRNQRLAALSSFAKFAMRISTHIPRRRPADGENSLCGGPVIWRTLTARMPFKKPYDSTTTATIWTRNA